MIQAGVMQPVGDLLVIVLALGLAAFGYRHGLFLATLSGLAVLVSLVVALAVSGVLAELVVSLGCPEPYAVATVFGLVFGGCLVGACSWRPPCRKTPYDSRRSSMPAVASSWGVSRGWRRRVAGSSDSRRSPGRPITTSMARHCGSTVGG